MIFWEFKASEDALLELIEVVSQVPVKQLVGL